MLATAQHVLQRRCADNLVATICEHALCEEGYGWTVIGNVLGVSRQTAGQRFQ
jgi:hypothetical protein